MTARESLFAPVSAGDADAVTDVLLREDIELARDDVAYAMAAASRDGQAAVVAALLARGYSADLNLGGTTPLMEAARGGQVSVVDLLLDSGADPNAKDLVGWTALFYAARAQQADAVSLLITRGAWPMLHDQEGRTALYAARTQHFGIRLGRFLIGGVRRRWRATEVVRLLQAAGVSR